MMMFFFGMPACALEYSITIIIIIIITTILVIIAVTDVITKTPSGPKTFWEDLFLGQIFF